MQEIHTFCDGGAKDDINGWDETELGFHARKVAKAGWGNAVWKGEGEPRIGDIDDNMWTDLYAPIIMD